MSAFHITKASVKHMMKNGGGSIVLFSSAVALHGTPNHESIAAAKAGVYGLALSTAASYASKNIRVNCVAPGLVGKRAGWRWLISVGGGRRRVCIRVGPCHCMS